MLFSPDPHAWLVRVCAQHDEQDLAKFFATAVDHISDFYDEPLYVCAEGNFVAGLQAIMEHGVINPRTLAVALHTAIDFENVEAVDVLVRHYHHCQLPLPERAFVMACQQKRSDFLFTFLATDPSPELFQRWPVTHPSELPFLLDTWAAVQHKTLTHEVNDSVSNLRRSKKI